MPGALIYLRLVSLCNWLKLRARRLRQPKYLLGALVGCAYIYFFFFRSLDRLDSRLHALPSAAPALAGLLLLAIAGALWVLPFRRPSLGFTEAEIAFLFPAPITRSSLVHFRLLSGHLRGLAGALVMTLLSSQWAASGGEMATRALGWWIVLSTLRLHFNGAGLTLHRLDGIGLRANWCRGLALALAALTLGIAIARLPALPASSQDAPLVFAAIDQAATLADTAPLAWLLQPVMLILAPLLATGTREFMISLGPALALVVLHHAWVARLAGAFEDTALDDALRRSARHSSLRPGPASRRSAPFPLADTGWPETAFLWKNLLSTWPHFRLRTLFAAALVLAACCLWLDRHSEPSPLLTALGTLAAVFGTYTLIVGPQFARQDLRADLGHADLLKTYPLPGWRIVLGELLTPVAILTGILWLTLLAIGLSLPPSDSPWLALPARLAAIAGLGLVTPALTALQLLVPNAAALLFPAWFQVARSRGGGPDVIGQRMIFFFAQLASFALALAFPAAMGAIALFAGQRLLGEVAAIVIATPVIIAVLAGEVWCGVRLLGSRFERLDISSELNEASS